MASRNAIGVFDSGLGGLTAVKEFLRVLPNEKIIYFGDTGRVPYGTRSRDAIRRYAFQDASFLLSHNVKMVVAACGTVSSVAGGELREKLPVPYTGVVNPTAFTAVRVTKNRRVGIIGTAATVASHSYKLRLQKLDPGIEVFEQACPLFVPLVENGVIDRNDVVTQAVAARYLQPLKEQGVDTLILGCTHFPILRGAISDYMGEGVTLIDSGRCSQRSWVTTTRRCRRLNSMSATRPRDLKTWRGSFSAGTWSTRSRRSTLNNTDAEDNIWKKRT